MALRSRDVLLLCGALAIAMSQAAPAMDESPSTGSACSAETGNKIDAPATPNGALPAEDARSLIFDD